MSVSEADRLALSDVETFQDHLKPHEIFTYFRHNEPVAWCPEPWGGPGFWSITKYDDIQEISKLPKLFSSDQNHGGVTLPSPDMIAARDGPQTGAGQCASVKSTPRLARPSIKGVLACG